MQSRVDLQGLDILLRYKDVLRAGRFAGISAKATGTHFRSAGMHNIAEKLLLQATQPLRIDNGNILLFYTTIRLKLTWSAYPSPHIKFACLAQHKPDETLGQLSMKTSVQMHQ